MLVVFQVWASSMNKLISLLLELAILHEGNTPEVNKYIMFGSERKINVR